MYFQAFSQGGFHLTLDRRLAVSRCITKRRTKSHRHLAALAEAEGLPSEGSPEDVVEEEIRRDSIMLGFSC